MDFRIDKKAVKKYSLGQEPKEYLYWLAQTPETRFAAIEALRLQFYGENIFNQGLQRVYRIIKQTPG